MKQTALWTLLTFCSPAVAASIYGSGELASPVSYSNIDYEDPVFLDVAKAEQLGSPSITGAGNMFLRYLGEAQYGRIGLNTHVGGVWPSDPTVAGSANITLGFEDTITPQGLNALGGNYLLLDITLSGTMTRRDTTFGPYSNITSANFGIGMVNPLNPFSFTDLFTIRFIWFANRIIALESFAGPIAPLFTPYLGEEPHFTFVANPVAHYSFGTRGTVAVPLNGSPFELFVYATASSTCAEQSTQCAAITDFGNTALIGGARIVDANGDPIPGASFSSQSGYNYITPPGPLGSPAAVPEPASMILAGAGLAVVLLRKRIKSPSRYRRPASP